MDIQIISQVNEETWIDGLLIVIEIIPKGSKP
jgi:hypothetical protein